MSKNQFDISDKMSIQKNNLPEWTWDDIIKLGLLVARILGLPKERIYKGLYWLSQKSAKELITSNNSWLQFLLKRL